MMSNYTIWLVVEGRYLEASDIDGELDEKVGALLPDGHLYIRGVVALRRVVVGYVDSRLGLGYGFPEMDVIVHVDGMEMGRWRVLEKSVGLWRGR